MTTLRARIFELFDTHTEKRTANLWLERFLMILIIANVVAIVFESVPEIHRTYRVQFSQFETFSVIIFTIEYLARLWTCVEKRTRNGLNLTRWQYIRSPMALIDLIAILPFYLQLIVALDLRFLRAVRLLRVFKLTRYSPAFLLLVNVFKEERHSLIAAFSIMFVLLILSASGIYLIEHQVQPEQFGSIPAAMWWALVTLTTVGYGDVTPITAGGKVFGGLITILGMGMVALPTGIVVSGFAEQLRRRRETFIALIKDAIDDGVITDRERHHIEKVRRELNLTEEEAKLIMRLNGVKHIKRHHTCPRCGHKFD